MHFHRKVGAEWSVFTWLATVGLFAWYEIGFDFGIEAMRVDLVLIVPSVLATTFVAFYSVYKKA
jgi:hypothetical protein